jgi:hypothetical protein
MHLGIDFNLATVRLPERLLASFLFSSDEEPDSNLQWSKFKNCYHQALQITSIFP